MRRLRSPRTRHSPPRSTPSRETHPQTEKTARAQSKLLASVRRAVGADRMRIDSLLNKAGSAIGRHDWALVRAHCDAVLAPDPENADAISRLEAAARAPSSRLCAAKTFDFTSPRDATLDGFDEPVALYEVGCGLTAGLVRTGGLLRLLGACSRGAPPYSRPSIPRHPAHSSCCSASTAPTPLPTTARGPVRA